MKRTPRIVKQTAGRVVATSEIMVKVAERQRLAEQIKALEEQKADLEEELIDFMGDHEYLVTPEQVQLLQYSLVISNRLDTKALKETQPQIYEGFCVASESMRLKG